MEAHEIKYIVLDNVNTGRYTGFATEALANKYAEAMLNVYPLMGRPLVFKAELLPPP